MSLRDDGRYHCDKCGADVGNGDLQSSATAIELDGDSEIPTPVRFDFCRDREENGKKVRGCASRVFTPKALADYIETRTTA